MFTRVSVFSSTFYFDLSSEIYCKVFFWNIWILSLKSIEILELNVFNILNQRWNSFFNLSEFCCLQSYVVPVSHGESSVGIFEFWQIKSFWWLGLEQVFKLVFIISVEIIVKSIGWLCRIFEITCLGLFD